MHGVADDNVHLQNTLVLLDKLDLENIDNYDMQVFPDSDHSINFHRANTLVYERTFSTTFMVSSVPLVPALTRDHRSFELAH